MNALDALINRLRDDAEVLHRYGDARGAQMCRTFADELEGVSRDAGDELVSLQQAADESGYSAEHLGRLIRDGKLQNRGRKGSPLLRRGDLPRKTKGCDRGSARGRRKAYLEDGLFRDIANSKFGGD